MKKEEIEKIIEQKKAQYDAMFVNCGFFRKIYWFFNPDLKFECLKELFNLKFQLILMETPEEKKFEMQLNQARFMAIMQMRYAGI